MNYPKFQFRPELALQWEPTGQWRRTKDGTDRRHGCSWNDAERRHLLGGYLSEGVGIPALARRHHRGVNGITSQLNRLLGSPAQHTLMLQLWSIEMADQPNFDAVSADFSDLERRALGSVFYGEPIGANTGRAAPAAATQAVCSGVPLGQAATPASVPDPLNRARALTCEAMVAWQQNRKVEWQSLTDFEDGLHTWEVYYTHEGTDNLPKRNPLIGDPAYVWRVMPTKVQVEVGATLIKGHRESYVVHAANGEAAAKNLRLTFEDGRLVKATVLAS